MKRSVPTRFAVLALATLLSGTLRADDTAYDFLRNDVSSRAAAMAGSFVAATKDPNTLFYNPAGLSTMETPMGSVGFFKHLLDINAGYAAYGQEFEDIGHFGAGISYINYGTFDKTDEFGTVLGSFNANDLAFILGYSHTLEENLHYGVNLKYIFSSIDEYSSSGIGADVGILYVIPESRITLAASLRNIGAQLTSYVETKEDLPLDFAVGGSVIPQGLPLLLNINFRKLNENTDDFIDRFKSFSLGGEFTLSQALQFRFGYNNEQRRELKIGTSSGLAGFSGGIGITVSDYRVDYALSSLGKIGSLHRVSLGASF